MTGKDHVWHARRIQRAWTLALRAAEAGDTETKEQWLAEWQRLCNEFIAAVELEAQ